MADKKAVSQLSTINRALGIVEGVMMAHKYMECEACAYCDEDRKEQPCCGCVEGCNYESEGGDNG